MIATLFAAMVLAAEVSGEATATGRVPEQVNPRARFGLAVGFGAGPPHQESGAWPYSWPRPPGFSWMLGELSPFVELRVSPLVTLRVGALFQPGAELHEPALPMFTVGLFGALRFHLGERFEAGVGVEGSVMVFLKTDGWTWYSVGPALTPASWRLGARREHELSVSLSMPSLFTNGDPPDGVAFVRYAYLF